MFTLWNLKHPPRTLSASLQFDLHILGLALSPPENGILLFLRLEMAFYLWHPLALYEQSSEYLNYLWTLSKIGLPLLQLMMASFSTYLLWYILSMFAHSTLRSWRSLEILKVCPEKERKSCLWSVGIPKKHQRSSIFSWLSSKKEKDLKKVHFLFNYLRIGVLPVILPFSLHDHSLCKNIKFVWYLCLILVLITLCVKRWVCLIFGILQWCILYIW